MAHRIIVLRDGRLVEEAPATKMLSDPKEAYTRSLWAVRKLTKPEAPLSDDILLKVDHVNAVYGGAVKVLDDVTVRVPRGCTVAVVGESGSGKSTLARVVAGLLAPQAGTITFDGEVLSANLSARRKEHLRRIQMIYQTPDTALNPRQ